MGTALKHSRLRNGKRIKKSQNIDYQEVDSVDLLGLYLKDIRPYFQYGNAGESELFAQMNRGDENARDVLIKRNLAFVVGIAKKYQDRGLPLTDLVSEGNLGLLRALKKFDSSHGVKFSTYAYDWVCSFILLALNKVKAVNGPHELEARRGLLIAFCTVYKEKYGKSPTYEQITHVCHMSIEDVDFVLSGQVMSLDYRADSDSSEQSFHNVIESEEHNVEEQIQSSMEVARILNALDDLVDKGVVTLREKQIFLCRSGFKEVNGKQVLTDEEPGYQEIGNEHCISRERVRRLYEETKEKIQSALVCGVTQRSMFFP